MRKLFALLLFCALAYGQGGPPYRRVVVLGGGIKDPLSILGSRLKIWLDPQRITDGTNNMVYNNWTDLTANGHVFANATSGSRPDYVTSGINGKPSMSFKGTDDYLDNTTYTNTGMQLTVIVVTQRVAAVDDSSTILLMINAAGNDYASDANVIPFYEGNPGAPDLITYRGGPLSSFTAGHPGNGVAYIQTTVFDGTNNTIYKNRTASTSAASSASFGIALTRLGARGFTPANFYNGYIGTVLVCECAASPTELNQLWTYLSNRWGLGI